MELKNHCLLMFNGGETLCRRSTLTKPGTTPSTVLTKS